MTAPVLQLAGLRKAFGGREALRGVNLAAGKGEAIAILGASGSGKSTMLRCINMLETPDAGEIRFIGERLGFTCLGDGRGRPDDLRQMRRIRAQIGMVFQGFHLWSHRTVLENVIEAPVHVQRRPRSEAAAEAEALLERVGLADKRDAFPAQLSGGQQQRAAIARALAQRPRLLLVDEPTSALDPERSAGLLEILRGLADEGLTMLVVTHQTAFARAVSDRVVFLHQGLVDCEGPTAELFDGGGGERLARFLRLPAREKAPA